MAYLLSFLVLECEDKGLGERVALVEELVLFGDAACDHLGSALAISDGAQSCRVDAVLDEIVHHALGPTLAESHVVVVLASEVAVAGELDGHVGVVGEQGDEAVQRHRARLGELGTVKLVEDVADEHRVVDAGQGELQHVFLADGARIDLQLLLVVEVSGTGAQKDVVHIRLDFLRERAVGLHAQLEVGSVVAHHVHHPLGQLVAVLLIDPSLHGLYHLGALERHHVVPSSGIAPVGAEEASVIDALERHPEVVAARIHGVLQVLHRPVVRGVALGQEEVQPAHAGMSVGGEV